jgi:hypothetical protein
MRSNLLSLSLPFGPLKLLLAWISLVHCVTLCQGLHLGVYSNWEDNIKIDLTKTGWGDMDWIHLAQDRDQWQALVNTAVSFCVP